MPSAADDRSLRAGRWLLTFSIATLASLWSAAYCIWPRISFDDGPFYAQPVAVDAAQLPLISSTTARLFGTPIFILETRATIGLEAATVIVMKSPRGEVRWMRATAKDFGRIRLAERPPRWYPLGGWVVGIQPERTESGELYLSPWGSMRFFFHSW
jgi:hypothetical protein